MRESSGTEPIVVSDLAQGRWLVTLVGEHDLSTAGDLRQHLDPIYSTAIALVIDLSAASFIDSSILGVLVEAKQQSENSDCSRLALVVRPGSPPDRLLDLTGLRRAFVVVATVDEALASIDEALRNQPPTSQLWSARNQRIVKNEQTFRDYNNRRMQSEPIEPTDDDELIPFVCECGDSDCIEALMITASSFTEAHSAPNRFVVKPGHVYPDVERVIITEESFLVVEKLSSVVNEASS
jgi:anti-sigma B factor antagonist